MTERLKKAARDELDSSLAYLKLKTVVDKAKADYEQAVRLERAAAVQYQKAVMEREAAALEMITGGG